MFVKRVFNKCIDAAVKILTQIAPVNNIVKDVLERAFDQLIDRDFNLMDFKEGIF
jgi:hypothetical protein